MTIRSRRGAGLHSVAALLWVIAESGERMDWLGSELLSRGRDGAYGKGHACWDLLSHEDAPAAFALCRIFEDLALMIGPLCGWLLLLMETRIIGVLRLDRTWSGLIDERRTCNVGSCSSLAYYAWILAHLRWRPAEYLRFEVFDYVLIQNRCSYFRFQLQLWELINEIKHMKELLESKCKVIASLRWCPHGGLLINDVFQNIKINESRVNLHQFAKWEKLFWIHNSSLRAEAWEDSIKVLCLGLLESELLH